MITHQYEEFKPVRQIWTWLIIIFVAIVTLSWGMLTHMAVPDEPRQWDFDVLPDTPGQSEYSTAPLPQAEAAPPQIELLLELSDQESQPQ